MTQKQRISVLKLSSAVVAICFMSIATADAASIIYSNRSAWATSVGSLTSTLDFESAFPNANSPVAFGPTITISGIGFSNPNGSIFGISPAATTYAAFHSGNFLEWPNGNLVITLPSNVNSVGFDFGKLDGGLDTFNIALGNGDSFNVGGISSAQAFFGVISGNAFNTVTIRSDGLFPSFDNLSIVGTLVPVPAACWLMGSALVGLLGFSRNRNTAASGAGVN